MISAIFNKISSTEVCKILSIEQIQRIDSVKSYKHVIEVDTVVSLSNGIKELTLYIAIPDPPVTLPKVFISELSYEGIKFIPHINRDFNICVYDEGLNHVFNPSNFPEMVEEMIHKAKQIITKYHDSPEKLTEFEREFKAYWEISFNKNDIVRESGLSIITNTNLPYNGFSFQTPFNGFQYLIYQESDLFEKFKYYLDYRKIKYNKIEVFEITYDQKQPPFNLSFSESILRIKKEDFKRFKQTVNKYDLRHVLIFFKNTLGEFYGWVYNKTIPSYEAMLRHQRRKFTSWQIISGPDFRSSLVERIIFSELTPDRLDNRTSGYVIQNKISVSIIGLGSVGSNLLNYLIKLPIKKFHLVDSDILKLENIYRYQYGVDYIGMNKSEIAKCNILNKNPFCEVITNGSSVVEVLSDYRSLFDEYDLNIIVVGNTMLEKFLLDHLIITHCIKPLIIIWVEPFMASGQMLYVLPEDYSKAINVIQNYPFRVLNDRNVFNVYLKEGSCQSGYFPYSESNLTLFLSAVFPYLFEIAHSRFISKSKVITWIGDKEFIKGQGLALSDFGEKGNSFQTFINDL